LSIWLYPAKDVVTTYHEIQAKHGGRAILGLGVSHAPTVNSVTDFTYAQPMRQMREYLDGLDRAGLSTDYRILAALGPKMIDLAKERSAGAHPYCTTIEHTKIARERLGEGPLLIPEVKVIFEADPDKARAIARAGLDRYLKLDNYVNNLLRLGWTQEEIENGGSDALIDALAGWGSDEQIMAHIHGHLDAGADHVALHVMTTTTPEKFPLAEWRLLADLVADLL
jgi:probable F420-dependent oxidoreductase